MSFSGKTTYAAGASLPEIAEDVSDLVSINAPHETPLLDALGDAPRTARSTVHEWVEDSLLPNTDLVASVVNPGTITVDNLDRFRAGDLVRFDGVTDVALVTEVNDDDGVLTLTRGYGGTVVSTLTAGKTAYVIGNASLEGADADNARYTIRQRRQNYTQIFANTISVSGSELAANQIAVRDELAWQNER